LEEDIVKAGLKRLAALQKEIREKNAEASQLLKDIQGSCPHPERDIVEGKYRDYSWSDTCDPPFRVCRVCGYNEPGWGCGYYLLAPENYHIPTMERDEAMKFVRGGMMTGDEKNALLRAKWDKEMKLRRKEKDDVKEQRQEEG
jgi:hypothetical protein